MKARSEGDAKLLFEKCICEEKSAEVEQSCPEEFVVAFCLFSPAQNVALRWNPAQSSFSELSSTSAMHGSLESRELIALSLDSINLALLLLEPMLLGCAALVTLVAPGLVGESYPAELLSVVPDVVDDEAGYCLSTSRMFES